MDGCLVKPFGWECAFESREDHPTGGGKSLAGAPCAGLPAGSADTRAWPTIGVWGRRSQGTWRIMSIPTRRGGRDRSAESCTSPSCGPPVGPKSERRRRPNRPDLPTRGRVRRPRAATTGSARCAAVAGRRESAARDVVSEAIAARVPGAPASSVTGEVVLCGVVVSAFVLVAALVTVVLLARPTDPAERSARGLELPSRADQRWSIVVPGRVDQVEITERALLIRTQTELSALDPETGSTMWTRALEGGAAQRELHVVGSTAILVEPRNGASTLTTGIDVGSGAEWWSREGRRFLHRDRPVAGVVLIEWGIRADPAAGPTDRRCTGGPAAIRHGSRRRAAAAPRGAVGEAASRSTTSTPGVRYPRRSTAFGISTLAMVGDVLVGFDSESTIAVFDSTGTRRISVPLSAMRSVISPVVPNWSVACRTATSASWPVARRSDFASRMVGSTLPGKSPDACGAPVVTAIGPVSVARVVDPSSGEVDLQLIDPVDGTVIVTTDKGETREEEPIVGTKRLSTLAAVRGGGPRGGSVRVRRLAVVVRRGASVRVVCGRRASPGRARATG